MTVCDAQIHLFPPGSEERAARFGQRPMTEGEILAAMDGAGVDRAVLVPPNPDAAPASLAAARAHPDRFFSLGHLSLKAPRSRAELAGWQAEGWAGVRVSFPPWHEQSWLRDGTAGWFWPLAEELGIRVAAWAPRQLSDLAEVARRHPGLHLVVDHLGLAVDDRDDALDAVLDELVPLAALGNVAVKATSVTGHVTEGFPFPSLHARLWRVLDAFGPERVFWGTDLTRLECSYAQAVALFAEELGLDPRSRGLVMGDALMAWLGEPRP